MEIDKKETNIRYNYRKTSMKAMTDILKKYLRIMIGGLFIKDLVEFYRYFGD